MTMTIQNELKSMVIVIPNKAAITSEATSVAAAGKDEDSMDDK